MSQAQADGASIDIYGLSDYVMAVTGLDVVWTEIKALWENITPII